MDVEQVVALSGRVGRKLGVGRRAGVTRHQNLFHFTDLTTVKKPLHMTSHPPMRMLMGAAFTATAIGVVIVWRRAQDGKRRIRAALQPEALKALVCEGRGPFAPEQPSEAIIKAGKCAHGPILCIGPVVVQRAQFNALWLRIGSAGLPAPPAGVLREVVDAAIAAQSSPKKCAVYIGISNECLAKGEAIDLAFLHSRGFKMHHYRPAGLGEQVLVCDLAKMVPSYATSIEGVTGLVYSPDRTMVLGVWERGGWNTPGGAVDEGEDKYTALTREIREEVGVKLDPSVHPTYLGGWQKGRARDGVVNDNFSVLAVQAADKKFQIDNKEVL